MFWVGQTKYGISVFLFPLAVLAQFLVSVPVRADHPVTLAGETNRTAEHVIFVTCALTAMERKFHIETVPWERAQRSTKQGIYDGFFLATKSHARDQYATLSAPFFNINWMYVVKKNSGIDPSDPDFFQHTFSAVHGSGRHKWLKNKLTELEATGNIIKRYNSENVLDLLNAGRIDVDLENDKNLAKAFSRTGFNPSDFEIHLAKTHPVGVYFSNKYLSHEPRFLEQFNATVDGCRKN